MPDKNSKMSENTKDGKAKTLQSDPRIMEWQHKLDPSRFNKSRGAQYHTAPMVLSPKSSECPDGMPDDAIALLFYIDVECYIGEPVKLSLKRPQFIEGKPRSKSAKNGPIFVLDDTRALCAIPVKENYYWSANVLSRHEVLYASIVPNKPRSDGKPRKAKVLAVFLPNEDEK